MLKIHYESGVGRKIRVKRADEKTSVYGVIVEISAHWLIISVCLSILEAQKFFEEGNKIVREILSGKPAAPKRTRPDSRSQINPKSQL